MTSICSNLYDARNHELRFAILNLDIPAEELVKMSSDQLAPSTVKNQRQERQEKYFKEQVLVNDEAKIIAKTHKGESILTVDHNQDDYYFANINLLQEKSNQDQQNFEVINSDDEGLQKMDSSKELSLPSLSKKTSDFNKNNRTRECPYKNLNQDDRNLYFLLEEYTLENLYKKWDEKLKSFLKPETVELIHSNRRKKQASLSSEIIHIN